MSVRDECKRLAEQIIIGAHDGDYWCKTIDELFHRDDPSILWNDSRNLFDKDSSRTSPVSTYKTLDEYIYQKVVIIDENNNLDRLKNIDYKIWAQYFAYLLVIPFLFSKLREKFYYKGYSFFCLIDGHRAGRVGDSQGSVIMWLINHKNTNDKRLFILNCPDITDIMTFDLEHSTLKDLMQNVKFTIFCDLLAVSTLSNLPENLIKLIEHFNF